MLSRWLMALALIAAPAWAGFGAASPAADRGACPPDSCCIVIREKTCCGERIVRVEHRCGGAGGHCTCGMHPGRSAPQQHPKAPAPTSGRDLLTAVLSAPVLAVVTPRARPDPVAATGADGAAFGKSHNAVQALLGVWRT